MKTTPIPTDTKVCKRCKIEQPLDDFPRNKLRSDGHISICKKCQSKAAMQSAKKHPETKAAAGARYYARNAEEKRAYAAKQRAENPEKIKAEKREYHAAHKDEAHASKIKRAYGITIEEYSALLVVQQGGCAICGLVPKKRRLYVDHCHSTKKVRGLLCHHCNVMLGMARDSIETLDRAKQYLQQYP